MKMVSILRIGLVCAILSLSCRLQAVPRADRTAAVDAEGVLRWTDDHSEVALVGVNYYPPFSVDYRQLTDLKADIKAEMRRDVAHFRRLGLGVVRIHCFDREFSTADGGLVDNHHLELLDDLIDLCAANGIYMVLTPIAWWGGGWYAPGNMDGFSNHFDMRAMTSDPRAWRIQARFLKHFAEHVNRYTGRRYADDPAVLAFECINEPLYPKDHPDSAVTDYINTLTDALRASGTKKPIYYNSWQKRNAAAGASRCDGVTGSTYPTGLVAGHALEGPQLGRIRASSLNPDASIAKKSRMIYEFDAADTPGSYMYPAFGRLFRHEGVQVAAMFQYDPLRIAHLNLGWRTHHLNLVYTPAKAISLAIMAETFRHLPRGCDYTPHPSEIVFPPFRVDAHRDLSEFMQGDRYYYTSDPVSHPAQPAVLRHIWGCGASPVAGSTGSGTYFLDKVAEGLWRLQLYPGIFTVNDPYSGRNVPKEVVLAEAPVLRVTLPDLGPTWTATPLAGGTSVRAVGEKAVLMPGDYMLTKGTPDSAAWTAARAADLPPFVAPPAEPATARLSVRLPSQWNAVDPLRCHCRSVATSNIVAEFVHTTDGAVRRVPVQCEKNEIPGGLLTSGTWGVTFHAQGPNGPIAFPHADSDGISWSRIPDTESISLLPQPGQKPTILQHDLGASAVQRADGSLLLNTDASVGRDACGGCLLPLSGIPATPHAAQLILEVENRASENARLELGFRIKRGGFGANLDIRPGRNVITIRPEQIQPLWNGPKTARPWEHITHLSILTGAWLMNGRPVPAQSVVIRNITRVDVRPGFNVRICERPDEWEFFDIQAALRRSLLGKGPEVWHASATDDRGAPAYHLHANAFTNRPDSISFRLSAAGADYTRLFPKAGRGRTLVLHARGVHPRTNRLELALLLDNGEAWGTEIELTPDWRNIRIPMDSLRYFRHWGNLPPIAPGTRPDIRRVQNVNFCFGRWLFPSAAHLPHAVEVSSLRVED